MTKKLPPEQKKKAGRKSKYNPEFHPKRAGELALMGKIDSEMIIDLDVSEATFNNWKNEHPEFLEALKINKNIVDGGVVKSLLQRAKGYEYQEKKRVINPDGSIRVEETIKQVVPDVTAQIFWLKNRQPKDWRDKRDMEVTGKEGAPLELKIVDMRKKS